MNCIRKFTKIKLDFRISMTKVKLQFRISKLFVGCFLRLQNRKTLIGDVETSYANETGGCARTNCYIFPA